LSPTDLPRLQEAAVDGRALGFATGAAALTAILCGLAPMLSARRLPIERALRAGARSLAGGRPRMGRILGVVEVALSLILLVGAGLLVRSFVRLREAPLGFDPGHLLSAAVETPENRYPKPPQWRAFHQDLLARVRALPGVESAAVVMLR